MRRGEVTPVRLVRQRMGREREEMKRYEREELFDNHQRFLEEFILFPDRRRSGRR